MNTGKPEQFGSCLIPVPWEGSEAGNGTSADSEKSLVNLQNLELIERVLYSMEDQADEILMPVPLPEEGKAE